MEPTAVEGPMAVRPTKRIDIQVQGRARDQDELLLKPFGRYVLLKRLASGGMGEIFLAKSAAAGGFTKLVAIKRILAHYKSDDDHVRMFFDEAKLQALLNDRHVVQIWDMGEIDDHLFIAMEYVHGVSWRRLLERVHEQGRILHPAHACDLAIQVAKGLSYAHNVADSHGKPLNIVHRDVNPQNLLTSFDGEVKIIDFGIAKSDINDVNTATGTLKGKFAYMSPEQGKGDKLDKRSDIFSFGICLYELLTRKNPFKRNNVVASLAAIQHEDPTPVEELRPDCVAFSPIIDRCLQKDARDRYQDAAEIAEELIDLYAGGAINEPKMPLATWLQDMFEIELAEHVEMLDKLGSSGGFSLRKSPLVSNPNISQPYSTAAEASDPRRRRDLHDAPTNLLAPEPTRAGPEPLSFTAQAALGSTLQGLSSYTAEGEGPSSELAGLPSVTAEGPPPLPDRKPEPAASLPEIEPVARAKGETDPTVSQPMPVEESMTAEAPARGRSLIFGTLAGMLVGVGALAALMVISEPEEVAPGDVPSPGATVSPDDSNTVDDPAEPIEPGAVASDPDTPPVAKKAPTEPGATSSPPGDEPGANAVQDAPTEPGADPSVDDNPPQEPPQKADNAKATPQKKAKAEKNPPASSAETNEKPDPREANEEAAAREGHPASKTSRTRPEKQRADKQAAKPKPKPKRPKPAPAPLETKVAQAEPVARVKMRLPKGYKARTSVDLFAGKGRKVTITGPEGGFKITLTFAADEKKVKFKLKSEPFGIVRVNNVGTPKGASIELPFERNTSVIVKSPRVAEELKIAIKATKP